MDGCGVVMLLSEAQTKVELKSRLGVRSRKIIVGKRDPFLRFRALASGEVNIDIDLNFNTASSYFIINFLGALLVITRMLAADTTSSICVNEFGVNDARSFGNGITEEAVIQDKT